MSGMAGSILNVARLSSLSFHPLPFPVSLIPPRLALAGASVQVGTLVSIQTGLTSTGAGLQDWKGSRVGFWCVTSSFFPSSLGTSSFCSADADLNFCAQGHRGDLLVFGIIFLAIFRPVAEEEEERKGWCWGIEGKRGRMEDFFLLSDECSEGSNGRKK